MPLRWIRHTEVDISLSLTLPPDQEGMPWGELHVGRNRCHRLKDSLSASLRAAGWGRGSVVQRALVTWSGSPARRPSPCRSAAHCDTGIASGLSSDSAKMRLICAGKISAWSSFE